MKSLSIKKILKILINCSRVLFDSLMIKCLSELFNYR